MTRIAAAMFAAGLLAACDQPSGPTDRTLAVSASDFSAVSAVSAYSYTPSVDENLSISLVGPAGTSLYFFLTNTSASDYAVTSLAASARSLAVDAARPAAPESSPEAIRGLPGLAYVKPGELAAAPRGLAAPAAALASAVGDPASFNLVTDWDTGTYTLTSTTCRATVSSTADDRTLYVYVANSDWDAAGDGGNGANVTQAMVDAMAAKFLAEGTGNDIYEWVSGIFGAEWGDTIYSNTIPFTNEISIVLGDIDADQSPNGGIVGYFDSANNLLKTSVPYSNERIMFFVDSYMYANADAPSWDPTDYWPEECFATLAHEFQHMIHYYQKYIRAGSNSDTWLDEMCSGVAEDFVAEKLGIPGPRGWADAATVADAGTTAGRLPLFSYWPEYPLARWTGTMENYSTVYAFGAWLARNHGGAPLFGEIVSNAGTGMNAVTAAIASLGGGSESARSLLTQWGIACLASSYPGSAMVAPYGYNKAGAFTVGGYSLGPIDLERYRYTATSPVPIDSTGFYVYAGVPDGAVNAAMGNIYFTMPPVSGADTASGQLLLRAGQTLTAVAIP